MCDAQDGTRTGGFTTGEPWLPMGHDVADRNVKTFQADERSLLWLYRRLIRLRREEPTLIEGEYLPMRSHNDILVYRRVWEDDTILVALNTVHEPRKLQWDGRGTRLLSTYLDGEGLSVAGPVLLRADEGILIKLQGR